MSERTAPAGRVENRRDQVLPGSHEGQTVGVNRPNEGARETERSRFEQGRFAQSRAAPIIRNSVFASQSPRAVGASPSQWTFRGRFADSALAEHHHHHAGVVLGFIGGLFWPYAYDDFIDYTFAPYAYDTFWPYAFDDVYAEIYGGYAPEYYAPEDAYAYAGSPASERAYARVSREIGNAVASGERICNGQAQGVTDFSIQKIADQVPPDEQQQALLDDLKAATLKAVDILQAACPAELPSTPTGRLAAMRARVDAMLRAVQTVRPALDRFYQSLNDEQRERFNALDQLQAQAAPATSDNLCSGQEGAHGRVPIDRIERTLHLNRDQEDRLQALNDATLKAADTLKAQCQPTQNLTPTGRLAGIEERLAAVSKALETTQVALDSFYASLSDEQKARFDRINVRSG